MNSNLDEFKLSCELFGHSDDVRCVAVGAETPEGQVIISASRDMTVRVWKPSGEGYSEVKIFHDHTDFVSAVYFLEREFWICTGSHDTTINLYYGDSYERITTLRGHAAAVCAFAAGINDNSILSGSWDKTARVWTIDTRGAADATYIELVGHQAAVWAVATNHSQRLYITGSLDKHIKFWSVIGECTRTLDAHDEGVRAVLLLADNCMVSCANDAKIRYWSAKGTFVDELKLDCRHVYTLAQNRALDEDIVVSAAEDGLLQMWNVNLGRPLGNPLIIPTQSVWSVGCLNSGDIVTGCSDGVIRIFTSDQTRYANMDVLQNFNKLVNEKMSFLGIDMNDKPGPEALLLNGTYDDQHKVIRNSNGIVQCFQWKSNTWIPLKPISSAGDVKNKEMLQEVESDANATSASTSANAEMATKVSTADQFRVDIATTSAQAALSYSSAVAESSTSSATRRDLSQVELELALILKQINRNCFMQLMGMRALFALLDKEDGFKAVTKRLRTLLNSINTIQNGNNHLQIATAKFLFKITQLQVQEKDKSDSCKEITDATLNMLLWADDLKACYHLLNTLCLLCMSPYGAIAAIRTVSSSARCMAKINALTDAQYNEDFVKINKAGKALLKSLSCNSCT